MAVLLENMLKPTILGFRLALYFFVLIWLNTSSDAINGRVTIDGSGSKYVIEGNNLTLICRHDFLMPELIWYNLDKVMIPKAGSVHITKSQLLHYNSSMNTLELINVTSEGTFRCMCGDSSFEVAVIVLKVFLNDSIDHNHPTVHNLSCELTGFTHNLPKIKVFWILPSNHSIYRSMNEFDVGVSEQKHLTWLAVDARNNPGSYHCIFELPSLDGSFIANGSFVLPVVEAIGGGGRHPHFESNQAQSSGLPGPPHRHHHHDFHQQHRQHRGVSIGKDH